MKLLLLLLLLPALSAAPEDARPVYRIDANRSEPLLRTFEQAFQSLNRQIAPLQRETVSLFREIWNANSSGYDAEARAARRAALHRWIDAIGSEGTTDARAFLIVDAQKRWNRHYCSRERDFLYHHLYQGFSSAASTNVPHLRHFLDHACSSTPFDGRDALVLMDAIHETWPDNRLTHMQLSQWRLWTDAAGYAPAVLTGANETTRRRLRFLLHDYGALLDRYVKSGLTRWRFTYGKDLPASVATAMRAMRDRHEGKAVSTDTLLRIEKEAAFLDPDFTGFLPRCELAVEPGYAPRKSLDDPSANIFLMPDTSAVALPQWKDSLLGGGTLEKDCAELSNLAQRVSDADTLKALMAFSLAEGDQVLPDGFRRLWMNVDGYDTFRYRWVLTYSPHGIDIVITGQGPRFSRDDARLRQLSRAFAVTLHRCVLRLALLERDGETQTLREGCKRLASVLDKHDLWPLLCNEYCLRGISPEAYVELLRSFGGKPEILPAFACAAGMEVVLDAARAAGGGEIAPRQFANLTRDVFVMNGSIPADDEAKRAVAASWLRLAQKENLPGLVSYLSFVGRSDVIDAWEDIPAACIAEENSHAGYLLVRHALDRGDVKRAQALFAKMTEKPIGYSYPQTRLALAALQRQAGDDDRADQSVRDALVLAALRTKQGGFQEYAARHTLIRAGLVDEAEKLLTLISGRDNRFLQSELLDAMANARQYDSAAFIAGYLLHQACLNATPSRGLGTQAEIAGLRLEADVYRALALLARGKLPEAQGMLERALPLIERMPKIAAKLAPHLMSCSFLSLREREGIRERLADALAKLPGARRRDDVRLALTAVRQAPVADIVPATEESGADAENYDDLATLASPVYDWHLLLDGEKKIELLKASIVRANYANEKKRWVSLKTEAGRMRTITLDKLAPEDIDNLIDWKERNGIRSWKLKRSPWMLEGKLIEKSEGGEGETPGSRLAPSVLLRLSFNVPYRVETEWLSDEDRAYVEQWRAPVGNGKEELRVFSTWQRAQAYAECRRQSACAYVLGKRGGPEEAYFRKTVLERPAEIRRLNASCAVVLCYQDAAGDWDANGRAVFRMMKSRMEAISPPGTGLENNPYRSGFCMTVAFRHASLTPFPLKSEMTPRRKEFETAVKSGNPGKVRSMLEEDPSLMETRFFNRTWSPLYLAIVSKKPGVVDVLLDKGANPNQHDSMGRPMLAVACNAQTPRIVESLLKHGADPNRVAHWYPNVVEGGQSVFSVALNACHGNAAVMDLLLAAGAKPDGCAPAGDPPVVTFVSNRQLDEKTIRKAVEKLARAGADLNAFAENGQTALNRILADKSPKRAAIVRILLEAGADPNVSAPGLPPPLIQAATLAPELIPVLIEAGADPNLAEIDSGDTVLARVLGNRELVSYLVDHGARVDAKPRGNTLLHSLLYGLTTRKKPTPEKTAATLELAAYLIARGCPVNEPDSSLRTPLSFAREHCVPEVVEFLLKQGATDPQPASETERGNSTPR